MRWKTLLNLIFCGVFIILLIIINWGLRKNLNYSEWVVLIALLIPGMGFLMTFLDKYFGIFKKIHDAELQHSEHLIMEIFGKPIVVWDVVYDMDEICQSGGWDESNPMLKYAIQHLNHKKYKKTWQAYTYGQTQVNKTVKKIQQYREIVWCHLNNAKLPFKIYENKHVHKKGVYNQKLINHLIFYDVLKKLETGATNKILESFPMDIKQTTNESIFSLKWRDYNPKSTIKEEIVATGDRISIESLQKTIEQIEHDTKIITIVLEIDSLKTTLKNNSELKIFEDGRLEIIKQVKILKEPLAGECKGCP